MRSLIALLAFLPFPALAERFEATAKITHVVVSTPVAQISRTVSLTVPVGQHEVLIPNFTGFSIESLNITASDGVQILSTRLASDRQPLTEEVIHPEYKAAEALVEQREEDLRKAQREVDLLWLKAQAAEAQAAYLRQIGTQTTETIPGPELLRAIGDTIRSELDLALETAKRATFAAEDAERGLNDLKKALQRAILALKAAPPPSRSGSTTILSISASAAGPIELTLTSIVPNVYWLPVYDLYLTRGDTPELTIKRGAVVAYENGEDWFGVTLTLSTALSNGQIDPSEIHAERRYIYEESETSSDAGSAPRYSEPPVIVEEASPVVIHDIAPTVDYAGANVTYEFPMLVDLRSDVDHLRLELGSLTLTSEVLAVAAPLYDDSAYYLARFRNDSPELLLPGLATLWLEGQMVGQTELPLLASGAETEIGFGPIHGLTLKRITPERSQGSAGLIGRSYVLDEQVRIEIENLTAESWPVRLIDRVPYSEQENLTVNWTADPMPTETNRDGQRGVLEWRFDLAAGEKRQMQLGWQLRWPSGYVLQ